MSITVEFKDLEEMKNFARNLLGEQTAPQASLPVAPQASAPVTPATYAPVPVFTPTPVQPQMAPPMPVPAPVPIPPVATQPVQTSAVNYTLDDLGRAAMTLMDSGKQGTLLELLRSFGVEALPALPPSHYGAFATALRGLGAQI